MISKSKTGTILERINQDARFANNIFMENAPEHNGYKTEIQMVERLAKMEVQTTGPYYPLKNKYESVITIIQEYDNGIRFHRNISKRIWVFGMV